MVRAIQWVFDRERLALGIHRERGDLAQGIRDGREIACGIVAECGRVVDRISDGGHLIKDRLIGHGGEAWGVVASLVTVSVLPLAS